MNRNAIEWIVDRRIRTLVRHGLRRVGKALDAVERAERAGAAREAVANSRTPVRSKGAPSPGRVRLRFVAIGLTTVNAAAVVLMLCLPDETTGDPDAVGIAIAALLGTLLAGSQIACAASLGTRLQAAAQVATSARRLHSRRRESCLLFEGAALSLLCTLVGWLIYLWVRIRIGDDHVPFGTMLGLALALQAWIAPWLLVADMSGVPPTELRRLNVLDQRMNELSVGWESDRGTASIALIAARSALHRADRVLARTEELSSLPPRASWSHALQQLTAGIAVAATRYAGLTSGAGGGRPTQPPDGPSDRDDLDLAGAPEKLASEPRGAPPPASRRTV